MLSRILICFCFIFLGTQNYSQDQIQGSLLLGKIVKHKKGLLYGTPTLSWGMEWSFISRTSGKKAWHQQWNRPDMGVSLIHIQLGNKDTLGNLTALVPFIDFYLNESLKGAYRIQFGVGPSYVTKKYNERTNPNNNAIGSNWNAVIHFKFGKEWWLSEKVKFKSGISFTHFSNGRTSFPNSGINVLALSSGVNLILDRQQGENIERYEMPEYRKWGFNVHGGVGIKEYPVPGGPNYGVKILSSSVTFTTNPFNRLIAGWEYEYHYSDYAFAIATFNSEEQAQSAAQKHAVFLGDELFFGPVSLRFQLGYYLKNSKGDFLNTKLFVNYTLPILIKGVSPFLGVMMKTHFSKANYLSFVGGIRF